MKTRLFHKKLWLAALPIATALLVSGPVDAQTPITSIQTVADTAGATLLVPYFEVDLDRPAGKNTIFTINNTGAQQCFTFGSPPVMNCFPSGPTATLAHVVIWSDLGVPVFNFNLYLTGLDVERVDMRKVLSGTLPRSASAGQDPSDTISPKGMISQDINFASCNGNPAPPPILNSIPYLPAPALNPAQLDNLVKSLTGNPSPSMAGLCAGLNHNNDHVARGYVTIDTVNNCTARFPGDAGYFASGGSGDATNQVQLTGEVYYVEQSHEIAYGGNLVHIHADATNAATSTPGRYTFYGRYDSWTAADNRQPLATTFSARFLGGAFTDIHGHGHPGSTSLIVWRDSKVAQQYFTCGATPPWYPLSQESIVAFDEQERPQVVGVSTPFPFPSGFPAATQKVPVGGTALPVSFKSGWIYLNLNHAEGGNQNPPIDPAAAQAWVDVVEQDGHRPLAVMHRAQQMDSGTSPNHLNLINF